MEHGELISSVSWERRSQTSWRIYDFWYHLHHLRDFRIWLRYLWRKDVWRGFWRPCQILLGISSSRWLPFRRSGKDLEPWREVYRRDSRKWKFQEHTSQLVSGSPCFQWSQEQYTLGFHKKCMSCYLAWVVWWNQSQQAWDTHSAEPAYSQALSLYISNFSNACIRGQAQLNLCRTWHGQPIVFWTYWWFQ